MINLNGKMVFTEEEREELATIHCLLVHKVASSFRNITNQEIEELHGVAQIGFVNALNSYLPDKGTKFSTYAVTCMQKQILSFLRGESKRTKLKVSSLDEITRVSNSGSEVTKSDAMLYKEIMFTGKDFNCVETGYQKAELEEYLRKEFESMDKTFAKLLVLRFGLFSTPEYTQSEIAVMLGTSQSNISKMEKKALDQLGKSAFLAYCGNESVIDR